MDTSKARTRQRRRERKNGPPQAFVDALLRNPLRARIMDLLETNPGMNKTRLADELGIHLNALMFHLERLVRVKLVHTRAAGGRETICFTAQNVWLWDDEPTRILFGRGSCREVGRFMAENPGVGVGEICAGLGLSIHTVRRHLRRLEESGLVERMRVDRQVIYSARESLVEWMDQVGGTEERWAFEFLGG